MIITRGVYGVSLYNLGPPRVLARDNPGEHLHHSVGRVFAQDGVIRVQYIVIRRPRLDKQG